MHRYSMPILAIALTAKIREKVRLKSLAFFMAGSLLVLSASGGVSADDTAVAGAPRNKVVLDRDVGGSPPEPQEISSPQQDLLGGNNCKNVDIRVLNSLPYSITVRSLEYYNGSRQKWVSEGLANRVVSPTAMEFWSPNFENALNDWIYSFNVIYDHGSHNGDVAHINTPDQTCISGRVFLLELK
jgi:hypothetical protein